MASSSSSYRRTDPNTYLMLDANTYLLKDNALPDDWRADNPDLTLIGGSHRPKVRRSARSRSVGGSGGGVGVR